MLKKSLLLLTLAVCMAGFNGNSEAAAAKALTAKHGQYRYCSCLYRPGRPA